MVEGAPDDVIFGVHMCRGNFKGHYLAAGGYELVAERFFSETRVNHFLLEYDTEARRRLRAAALRAKDKGVVLGLVSSKVPALERHRRAQAARRRGDAVHRSATGWRSARNAASPLLWRETRLVRQMNGRSLRLS